MGRERVDGIIYGAASSLGFAAVENIKYFAVGRLSPTLVLLRTFTSIPAHMFFGAIWGYALGKKLISKKTSILLYLGWAALMHGAFDTVLSIDGLQLAALAVNMALATIFVLLLRKALRHGRITPDMDGAPAASRMYFTVGSLGNFVVAAIAVHVFAASVVLVSAIAQGSHMRVGFWLISASSALVALLGLSAWWVSATLPLDVAVDDYGVTFAGTARPWASITHFEHLPKGRASVVQLHSTEGDLTLGPGAPMVVSNLARAIAARLVGRGAASPLMSS